MKLKNINIAAILTMTLYSGATLAFSFGSPSIGGLTGGSKSGGTDLIATQKKAVTDYVSASVKILFADAKMAEAIGLQSEVAKYKATADSIKSDTSEGSLDKSVKTMNDAGAKLEAKLKTHPTLGSKEKKMFASGLVDLTAGAIMYGKMGKGLSSAKSALNKATPMDLMKLRPLVYMAKNVPDSGKNASDAISAAIQFAKGQDIPVPANAADATDLLGNM